MKVAREIEPLELARGDLQVATAESDATPAAEDGTDERDEPENSDTGADEVLQATARPRRRSRVADGTPWERREIGPGEACPGEARPHRRPCLRPAPMGGPAPPAVACRFSPDRTGAHPEAHLAESAGILRADACSGFRGLCEKPPDGSLPQFREVACWAHLRRAFHDVWDAAKSPIAREALDGIGKRDDIEREITGQSAAARLAVRKARSAPKVDAFRTWAEAQLARIPGNGDLARAVSNALNRWPSFRLFLDRIHDHKANHLDELLPWH